MISSFLAKHGYTSQLNDSLYKYLGDLGYSGQLNERLYNYLEDGNYNGTLTDKIAAWNKLVEDVSLSRTYTLEGLKSDMTTDYKLGNYAYQDVTTNPEDLFYYTQTAPRMLLNEQGVFQWQPHNLANNPTNPATQTIVVPQGETVTVGMIGSGSFVLSGAGTGTVSEGVDVEVVASTTSLVITLSGSATAVWAYYSSLGGMIDVPLADRAVAAQPKYASDILPRYGSHVYSGAKMNKGMQFDSYSRTNLCYPSASSSSGSAVSGASVTDLSLTLLGGLDGMLVESQGAVSDRAGPSGAVLFGDGNSYTIVHLFSEPSSDSSGRVRSTIYAGGGTTDIVVSGAIGSATSTTTVGGTINWVEEGDLTDSVKFLMYNWTNTLGSDITDDPAIGPDTATSGDGIVSLGTMVFEADGPVLEYLPSYVTTRVYPAESLLEKSSDTNVTDIVDTANLDTAWFPQGSNTVTLNGDGHVEITYVSNSSGALMPLTSAGGLTENLNADETYTAIVTASITGGALTGSFEIWGGASVKTSQELTTTLTRYEMSFVKDSTGTPRLQFSNLSAGEVVVIHSIEIRKGYYLWPRDGVDDRALGVTMRGFVSYADDGATDTISFFRKKANASNQLTADISTDGVKDGELVLGNYLSGTATLSSVTGALNPGVSNPFSLACLFTDDNLQAQLYTSATTASAHAGLPDLEYSPIEWAYNFTGLISLLAVFTEDESNILTSSGNFTETGAEGYWP